MTNSDRERLRRERQYELDRVRAQYEDELRAGRAPRLEEYLRRYPALSAELTRFALYVHTVDAQEPQVDAVPAPALSPAAQAALSRISLGGHAEPAVEPARVVSLIKRARAVGLTPPSLAAAVGLSADILAKLESRAIEAATVPPTLIRRLAETLTVVPDAVQSYLAGENAAGGFYFAEQAPTRSRESFASAIGKSAALPAEQKEEWLAIVRRELPEA